MDGWFEECGFCFHAAGSWSARDKRLPESFVVTIKYVCLLMLGTPLHETHS